MESDAEHGHAGTARINSARRTPAEQVEYELGARDSIHQQKRTIRPAGARPISGRIDQAAVCVDGRILRSTLVRFQPGPEFGIEKSVVAKGKECLQWIHAADRWA